MRLLVLSALIATASLLSACSDETETETPRVDETTAEATPAFYVGTWAADTAWCTGQGEGFPITIEADRFLGRENTCDMTAITDTPEGGWTAQLSCESEGMSTSESLMLSPVGDQLAITWPDRAAESTVFSRCE
ncbi:hypothetical protein [Pelagibacterium luteolum]|uniref:Protease inhibitor Inh n=1 Tax=Pelagibacterium luteolum TaxID=440168 RepID=A0A1G7XG00_9HYPH|nr:hypothetical protein [Pelagibacterium luteolum]SDG83034.1 hypothetical protein SAMN04487974_10984 [Pelagibacterium luteolum]